MTTRCVLGVVAVLLAAGLWSWCRPCGGVARGYEADPVYSADEPGVGSGGNRDEAFGRYRSSQARHWRQIAIGMRAGP